MENFSETDTLRKTKSQISNNISLKYKIKFNSIE